MPLDRAQTVRTLLPFLVEEAHEALDASQSGDTRHLEEELGDVCFVLALTLQTAEEEGLGPFAAIARRTLEKIRRRHPHVFAGAEVESARAVERRWEEIKREEAQGASAPESFAPGSLPDPAPALPALMQAWKLQRKAAAVGFDWPGPDPVFAKVEEELGEIREAMADEAAETRVREEVGDLLFAVVNLTRLLGLEPESALRAANLKFRSRFNQMMVRLAAEGIPPESAGLARLDGLWEEVKHAERAAPESPDAAQE